MFEQLSNSTRARSAALLVAINGGLGRILIYWIVIAGLAAAARISFAPHPITVANGTLVSYALLILSPVASTLLALRWFADGDRLEQPLTRLAQIGSWQKVTSREAKRHPLYGAGGIMVSLLVGMMLNVPVRAAEYLAAMPPLPSVTPSWLSALHFAMTLDVVLFGSLYMIAFVAALRRVPLFPRLLLAIWLGDLAMQLFTAHLVTSAGGLPTGVASALHSLLEGNVKKVLISMALWLPYLLLSTRVNITYRHRLPA
ncbi:DUF2569 domain-containing protein [Sphingomonas hankyongi]|uniref:DUF2569 domain-containing protein n=1 Tax=Sphingomonas hankyongi TaxID=2908209 RepID=A0ABT0S2S9_9SPHN|nr:DUF2569 domain-containing protein [Sphingomonas hankyongi]MCL6730180.1 DUF2569 domain-containing protein [Sphingomonas hankyongi]